MDTVEGCIEIGVRWLSAYAFSTENWKRSPDEVKFLMGFNRDVIRRRRDEMHAGGAGALGRARPRLWRSVIKELEIAEELTSDNTVMTLTMCVNYGGRAEIADAAREIARRVAAGKLNPERITECDRRPVPRRAGHARRRPVPAAVGRAARPTSCSGSPPTPKWCSRTSCFPTSTAATCGPRCVEYASRDRRFGGVQG